MATVTEKDIQRCDALVKGGAILSPDARELLLQTLAAHREEAERECGDAMRMLLEANKRAEEHATARFKAERERDEARAESDMQSGVEIRNLSAVRDTLRARLAMVMEALRNLLGEHPNVVFGKGPRPTLSSMHEDWIVRAREADAALSATEADVQAWLAAKRREWRIEGYTLASNEAAEAFLKQGWNVTALASPEAIARQVDARWPEDAPRKEGER